MKPAIPVLPVEKLALSDLLNSALAKLFKRFDIESPTPTLPPVDRLEAGAPPLVVVLVVVVDAMGVLNVTEGTRAVPILSPVAAMPPPVAEAVVKLKGVPLRSVVVLVVPIVVAVVEEAAVAEEVRCALSAAWASANLAAFNRSDMLRVDSLLPNDSCVMLAKFFADDWWPWKRE